MNLSYGIIGTGAIGGFYGGFLAKSGKKVNFLFNSDFAHVKQNGLKIESIKGDFHLKEINAFHEAKNMPKCDVILVCLKTTNNHILEEILPYVIHENSIVVMIQNGLGIEKALACKFPDLSIAGGLAFVASSKINPGHIVHYDYGTLTLGFYQNPKQNILDQICKDINEAGIECNCVDDLNLARWKKLLWNIPFNGVCVVLNAKTKDLVENPKSKQLVKDLMTEVVNAANHCGASLTNDSIDEMIYSTLKMKPYAPSMKLDFDFKRPMEIEAIYSNPIKEARESGYSMKVASVIEKQLFFIQSSYLSE